ncbi:protein of unknown function (plasmid) [Rhodovastum atsumiense]|nr:protein of unknown function [Rhodovastum atsumiense]
MIMIEFRHEHCGRGPRVRSSILTLLVSNETWAEAAQRGDTLAVVRLDRLGCSRVAGGRHRIARLKFAVLQLTLPQRNGTLTYKL